MKLLQIGDENWAKDLELPEQIEWLYTPSDKLQDYLEGLKAAEIAKIPEERLAEMEEPTK
ncbi:TPA: hypothetical protein U1246_002040, partial [Streptococcus suis]|nr:hypothetical protein [Streptococcus suis]